jgi:hypothetical protein
MFRVVYCTGDTIYEVPRVVGVVRKKGVRMREWGGWWVGRKEESEGDEEVARK